MADCYVQGSFAFTCSHAEMALIEEAFQASYDLGDGDSPTEPTPEFLAVFPPASSGDPWSGFLAIFPDPDFPNFGFEWACSCSRARIGEFGGGWCAVFADRVVFETTRQMLERALNDDPSGAPPPGQGHWDELPEHALGHWQAEVANGDTRLGYHAWAAGRAA